MKKMNIKTNADVRRLAHYIVYSLQRPDYHPDDHFGVAAIDFLVDKAFDACGEEVYRIFGEECYEYLKQARI